MKHAHPDHGNRAAWIAALAAMVVVLTLWMAWRLGGTASVPSDLRFRTPAAPSRAMPNPQPPPLPTSPRPG